MSISTPAMMRAERHRSGTRRTRQLVRAQLAEATALCSCIDADHGTGLSYAELREAHQLLVRAIAKLKRAHSVTAHERTQHETADNIGLAIGCTHCEDAAPGDGSPADAVLAGWIDIGREGFPLWCCTNCQTSTTAVAR